MNDRGLPIDGSVYSTNEYLEMLSGGDTEFYRLYITQLNYICGIFRIRGNKELEKLSRSIIRQFFEYGRVGITKIKGKYLPLAVVNVETDIYQETIKAEATVMRTGFKYTKDMKTFKFNKGEVAIGSANFEGLPFIFFWNKAIEEIIKLKTAAMTASISSIKKFKRVRRNNSSETSNLETETMMDPNTPYVELISADLSYKDVIENGRAIVGKSDKVGTSETNSLEFQTTSGSASQSIWNNLKECIEYHYYLLGREINTNKKKERNLGGEIESEKQNFDVIREAWYEGLTMLANELNEIFKDNITIEMTLQKYKEVDNEQIKTYEI